MSGPDRRDPPDEFGQIAELFRPLTRDEPGAFGLLDDAAVLAARGDADLVVTQDALVEGVHFPAGERPEDIAARFMRVNLSDLAAKGAEPFAWLQTVAWSADWPLERRRAFAQGLASEAQAFDLSLLGGDTVSTPGPLLLSGTFLGRCPPGGVIPRSGARPGDLLLVSGPIGDGWLGLQAVTGACPDPTGRLSQKFRRPEPRLDLRPVLRACARAAADVSDGLIADAGHLARASGCGLRLSLEQVPLSPEAAGWLGRGEDEAAGWLTLASGGDDYEIVLAADPDDADRLQAEGCTIIGAFIDGPSEVLLNGRALATGPGGWRHF